MRWGIASIAPSSRGPIAMPCRLLLRWHKLTPRHAGVELARSICLHQQHQSLSCCAVQCSQHQEFCIGGGGAEAGVQLALAVGVEAQGQPQQESPVCDVPLSLHRGNGADSVVAAHLVCYSCLLVIIIAWWLLVCPLTCARIIPPWADKPHAVHAVIQHAMRSISKSAASASTTSIPTAATPSAPTTPPLVLMP